MDSGVVWGGIGAAVGSGKGRGGTGLLLGILLGFIGVIIVAVMSPSREAEMQRDLRFARTLQATVTQPAPVAAPPVAPAVAVPRLSVPPRQQLMADAINRDPTLANPNDPATLKRLNAAIEELAVEYQTRVELEALMAAQRPEVSPANANSDLTRALDPQSDADSLWKLIRSEDVAVAIAAAQNPSTPSWVLRRMVRETHDPELKSAINAVLALRPDA
jgi:hypothetical protein